ncbi:MAG: hypothetical protein WA954_04005 [Parerythrobacter sp.]
MRTLVMTVTCACFSLSSIDVAAQTQEQTERGTAAKKALEEYREMRRTAEQPYIDRNLYWTGPVADCVSALSRKLNVLPYESGWEKVTENASSSKPGYQNKKLRARGVIGQVSNGATVCEVRMERRCGGSVSTYGPNKCPSIGRLFEEAFGRPIVKNADRSVYNTKSDRYKALLAVKKKATPMTTISALIEAQ